jgi:uncharacterized protein YkwD
VHGRVDMTDDREPTAVGDTGRHRGRRPMPAPLALGLTVVALLTAFGVGAALLPGSFTGSGAQAETPAAAIANLAPGAGGSGDAGSDGSTDPATDPATGTTGTDPSAAGPSSAVVPKAAPKVTKAPAPKPAPKPKVTKKPKPKPKAPPVKVGKGQTAQENEVIRLTNVERAKAGCGKVKLNTKLRTAMRGHTQDMANKNYFSHDSQDGRSPWARAEAAGYKTPIGENIAKGQRNAADVMNSWMNSSGHKANILNCKAKAIGVGLSYDGGTAIWGQLFGSV